MALGENLELRNSAQFSMGVRSSFGGRFLTVKIKELEAMCGSSRSVTSLIYQKEVFGGCMWCSAWSQNALAFLGMKARRSVD
jgi:hypothetical protein